MKAMNPVLCLDHRLFQIFILCMISHLVLDVQSAVKIVN